jgi:hypothetical protein
LINHLFQDESIEILVALPDLLVIKAKLLDNPQISQGYDFVVDHSHDPVDYFRKTSIRER